MKKSRRSLIRIYTFAPMVASVAYSSAVMAALPGAPQKQARVIQVSRSVAPQPVESVASLRRSPLTAKNDRAH